MTSRPITDHERREGQVFDPEPDFVDVHVTLDWIIRVHGTTDSDKGLDIAEGYVADQELHKLVTAIAHTDGILCDGEDLTSKIDERGYLDEDEVTIALYPESATLPTDGPAVSTYNDGWLK